MKVSEDFKNGRFKSQTDLENQSKIGKNNLLK
ncbi:hypothetical protein QF024_002862 [Chryseobacterium nepalense]|nr:hypothetical protein [Chryseobacterium nepalense]